MNLTLGSIVDLHTSFLEVNGTEGTLTLDKRQTEYCCSEKSFIEGYTAYKCTQVEKLTIEQLIELLKVKRVKCSLEMHVYAEREQDEIS